MKRLFVISFILLFVMGINISSGNESTPSELTFVYVRPLDHAVTRWLTLIYTEALRRMNIKFNILEVPPKRASVYSDDGDVDGELGRIYAYSKTHPNLVRVDEHHAVIAFSAFVLDSGLNLNGWNSLKNTNYSVEYRRGIMKCADQLPQVVPLDRLSEIRTIDLGFERLFDSRIQIYVDVEDFVITYLKSDNFQKISNGRMVYKAGIMEQTTGHAFLHKKHQKLIPKLSTVLRMMKKEGLFDAYRKQTGINLAW